MLRLAIAQINTTVGDLEGNVRKIRDQIARARQCKADIVAFPELAVTGYPPEDLLLKKHFIRDNLNALRSLIPRTADITAIVGFVDMDKKGNLFNAAAIIQNTKLKGVYHKVELPNYGVFDEKRYFTPGNGEGLFQAGKICFGVSICEDIWVNDGICRRQAKSGARVLINISSSPYHAGKGELREEIMVGHARRHKVHVCYVNLVGGQDELVFDGASMVVDPKGNIIAAGTQFEEDLIVADVNFRRPISAVVAQRLRPIDEIYRALVLGTRDYVRKNGFQKVVIGLSGGIDSSLTAMIACDAVGKENVIGISMPSRFTSTGTRSDARQLADNLGIRFYEIPIEQVFKSYLDILQDHFTGRNPDLTEENIQARIRGNILMAFSNKFGWLVLTTGNKSEVAVGYCTLYGDMAGGFAVIKDVPKTKVYDLARFRNENEKIIPQSVFDRPPTAELRENQKDQDSLPPYEFLDTIIEKYVELDEDLNGTGLKASPPGKYKKDRDVITKVIGLVDKSEYKRRQAPPGVRITPKAFGKDRRMPITNRYGQHL